MWVAAADDLERDASAPPSHPEAAREPGRERRQRAGAQRIDEFLGHTERNTHAPEIAAAAGPEPCAALRRLGQIELDLPIVLHAAAHARRERLALGAVGPSDGLDQVRDRALAGGGPLLLAQPVLSLLVRHVD